MFKYKNVLIYGYSKSGKAVERILINMEVNYKIYDDNMRLDGGKYLSKLPKKEIVKFDLIVISPAVSIYNKLIKYAESEGIRVISELEFGYLVCPYPIIAVTGTNGKTTVVKLLEHCFDSAGYKVKALGNVGEPLSEIVKYEKLDFAIVEVSSFQLEATYKFKPYIGVLLNIDEDHLDRHKTFANYLNLKLGLFKNCNNENYAVLGNQKEILNNFDNETVNTVVLNKDCKIDNGVVCYNDEQLFEVSQLNDFTFMDNILAVISVLKIVGLENEKILMGINTFVGLEHRLEYVDTVGDNIFYNDSKATNPHSTINAVMKLKQYDNITLLLGGQDKDFDFNRLIEKLPSNVHNIVCFGKCRKKIFKCIKDKTKAYLQTDLKSAVVLANQITKNGVILLSPACASFDEFKGYAERGKYFKNIVSALKQSTNLKEIVC
ncbi:MAG: UDP-N-acetylmuramoyl-L-alanine--D-glutamate ligase [Firmicutes bacterium]|nr:UDP-N-acetylmuramoyl-L-alanine--D-glutamate ligase [Bacillota bacterium]